MQEIGNSVVRVTSALTELILTGELPAGAPVREVEFARQLGTSRTPVREAIAQLMARGLLTKEGGRTAQVRQPTLEDVLELYELRKLTEGHLAELAAQVIDSPTLGRIAHLEGQLRTAAGDEWFDLHADFHLAILDAAERPRFSALVHDLRVQSEPYVRLATKLDASLGARAAREHAQLVEAMKAGDSVAAREITVQHLESTIASVTRVSQATRGVYIPVSSAASQAKNP